MTDQLYINNNIWKTIVAIKDRYDTKKVENLKLLIEKNPEFINADIKESY